MSVLSLFRCERVTPPAARCGLNHIGPDLRRCEARAVPGALRNPGPDSACLKHAGLETSGGGGWPSGPTAGISLRSGSDEADTADRGMSFPAFRHRARSPPMRSGGQAGRRAGRRSRLSMGMPTGAGQRESRAAMLGRAATRFWRRCCSRSPELPGRSSPGGPAPGSSRRISCRSPRCPKAARRTSHCP